MIGRIGNVGFRYIISSIIMIIEKSFVFIIIFIDGMHVSIWINIIVIFMNEILEWDSKQNVNFSLNVKDA